MRIWLTVSVAFVALVMGCHKDHPKPSATKEVVKSGSAPESRPSATPAKRDPIYSEKADARADIAKALTRAQQANKRVLIIYGGNWCSWCYRLHDLLTQDPQISREIERSYEVVHVEARLNPGIGDGYGVDGRKGFPYLTLLDANNKVIRNQETGVFEQRKGYKPAAVRDFLLKYRPEPKTRPATSQGSTAAPRGSHFCTFVGKNRSPGDNKG